MTIRRFKINSKNIKINFSMDIPTTDEFKIYLLEGNQVASQQLERKGRALGSSGRYYNNWSGALTRNITAQSYEYDKIEFFNNLFYAPYIEYGTGIYAKNGMGRKTPWTYYNSNYNTWVTTEGIKPRPFMEDALEESEDNIRNTIDSFIESWWNNG